jgi:hypothetical protein
MNKELIVLEFKAFLIYTSDRPMADILTEIRAIKGVTIVNILEKSIKMFDNKFFELSNNYDHNMYKALLSIKVEISKLQNINVLYFLKQRIMKIKSVKNCVLTFGE